MQVFAFACTKAVLLVIHLVRTLPWNWSTSAVFQHIQTRRSCLEGCVYNETEEDQQTEDMLECVMEASRNEFDIMECEHQHGSKESKTDERRG